MMWLLSLVGMGGIGAALVFIPGAAVLARQVLGAVLEALTEYPWQCATAVALCAGVWFWRADARHIDQRDVARAQTKVQVANHRETKRRYAAAQSGAKDAETARLRAGALA